MRPEGAEWLLQQNSGQPDPTELNAPSQWGSHAPILITPTSWFLLVCTVPAPYTIPATSNCVAVTLPSLSNALALLLPLSQHHGCVADRCLQAHPRSRWCRVSAGQRRVSLAVCRRLLRNTRQNSKKPRFHGTSACSCQPHPCRETKVHTRVGYVSIQVRTHRTSARGFLGRTLKHFPLPRHSPIKQTLFITWLTCQQGNPLP